MQNIPSLHPDRPITLLPCAKHPSFAPGKSICHFENDSQTASGEFSVVQKRRIPFIIEAPSKEDVVDSGKAAFDEMRRIAAGNGLAGMSLEEINKEIKLAREGK